jgi:hypothetical protein
MTDENEQLTAPKKLSLAELERYQQQLATRRKVFLATWGGGLFFFVYSLAMFKEGFLAGWWLLPAFLFWTIGTLFPIYGTPRCPACGGRTGKRMGIRAGDQEWGPLHCQNCNTYLAKDIPKSMDLPRAQLTHDARKDE